MKAGGRSAAPHRWEPPQAWLDQYDHPLWKRLAGNAESAGHGGMDFFVIHAFVEALKADAPMPIDIYDAVAWSAITPLSEQSIREGNRTLDFPDFTAGKWAARTPILPVEPRRCLTLPGPARRDQRIPHEPTISSPPACPD